MAHKLTLYARQAPPGGAPYTVAQIAAAGEGFRQVTGKKAGEVSVTYAAGASSASSAASTVLADLPETTFGLQLLSLIRLYSRSVYIP